MKRNMLTAAVLLLAAVMTAATACSDTAKTTEPSPDAQTTPAVTETETDANAYVYPTIDCGGESFRILNTNTTWGFHTTIYFDQTTGDTLDDTIFEANSKVEEAFNVKLDVTEFDINESVGEYSKNILTGDDVYQTALLSAGNSSSVILEQYVLDLSGLQNIHLDQPWWDQQVSEYSRLGGSDKVYFGISDINLMNFEVIEGVYVNDNKLANLDLTLLYDSVREGTWTLAKMHEYMKAAVNLNGETDFTFKVGGNSVYGLTYWEQGVPALLYGCGVEFIRLDDAGIPHLNIENEQFYNASAKIAELFKTKGETVFLNTSSTPGMHYEDAFKAGRSLFTIAQLKGSSKFRDMEDTYGILPAPNTMRRRIVITASAQRTSYPPRSPLPVPIPNAPQRSLMQWHITHTPTFFRSTMASTSSRNRCATRIPSRCSASSAIPASSISVPSTAGPSICIMLSIRS